MYKGPVVGGAWCVRRGTQGGPESRSKFVSKAGNMSKGHTLCNPSLQTWDRGFLWEKPASSRVLHLSGLYHPLFISLPCPTERSFGFWFPDHNHNFWLLVSVTLVPWTAAFLFNPVEFFWAGFEGAMGFPSFSAVAALSHGLITVPSTN